jgi:protein-tyrosine phosphatase
MVVMDQGFRLERVLNLRDLGGLATPDGRCVANGRIFRSGSLHEMTDADRSTLERLGIRTVIDLRSAWERHHQPYEWAAVRLVPAPLADDSLVQSIFTRFEAGTLKADEIADWWQLTGVHQSPVKHPASIRTIFQTLMEAAPDAAVLYHCTGGKDRTGMVSALVLEALGVRREAIVADFMLSNRLLDAEARADEFAARADEFAARADFENGASLVAQDLFPLTGVRKDWLDTFFGQVARRFGSVERYLIDEVGLGRSGLTELRTRYLQPAGT